MPELTELKPSRPVTLTCVTSSQLSLSSPSTPLQAIADCCRAIALNPHYAKAHSRLATLLSELGYYSDAVSALEAAAGAPGVRPAGGCGFSVWVHDCSRWEARRNLEAGSCAHL